MKSKLFILLMLLLSLSLFADDITFSGGYSKAVMNEGKRELMLSQNAVVTVGSLTIKANSITLSGDDYDTVVCNGAISIEDPEEGFLMRADKLYYDRKEERIIITSWCEISDRKNELEASTASLAYDLKSKDLMMEMRVRLVANTEDGLLTGQAESVYFNRDSNTLSLSGGAVVSWKGDTYKAQLITVDIDKSEINLDGRIEGVVHG